MNQKRYILAGLVLAALVVAVAVLPLRDWAVALVQCVRGYGAWGALLYALVYVVGTLLLVPGTALALGSGFLYGPFGGTLIVSPASVLGATLAFLLARSFARDWVARRIRRYPRFQAIDQAVGKRGFKFVLLLRLQPVFIPFAMLNYALGLTRVRLRDYVLGSWIGMLPATILYVYLGSVAQDAATSLRGRVPAAGPWGRALFWGGLVATAILVLWISRVARRALESELRTQTEPGKVA